MPVATVTGSIIQVMEDKKLRRASELKKIPLTAEKIIEDIFKINEHEHNQSTNKYVIDPDKSLDTNALIDLVSSGFKIGEEVRHGTRLIVIEW